MSKAYRVCVVGVGAVGREMIRLLRRRSFPMADLKVLARRARRELVDDELYDVQEAQPQAFEGVDFAFFAGTEGEKGASQLYGWEAVARGAVVIDNGDDFRMDPRVPLVVPEINAEALRAHQGFVANPNCTTAIAVMALAPLHRAAGLRRVVACSYQAVSGTGAAAIRELEEQVRAWAESREVAPRVYPHPIAFNVIPQIGAEKDVPGVTSEELKLRREMHKILGDDSIRVSATCVRVPVFNGHAVALHVELRRALSPDEARELLARSPGVRVLDELAQSVFPTPRACSGREEVLVGRIRADDSVENGLALFVCGDNLWKGAALNAIQIAEKMIEMGLR